MPDLARDCLVIDLNFTTGTVPEWVEMIPAPGSDGWVRGRDGRQWRMSNPQAVLDYLHQNKRDLVIDWEHASELRSPKGKDAPAAGWAAPANLRVTEAGAIEARVDWTERGLQSVQKREYRYISPVILSRKSDSEIVGLASAGLTNQQNLFNRALNSEAGPTQTPKTMNEEQMKELCRALGLPESSTAAEILSATNTLNRAKTQAESDLEIARNRADNPSLDKFVPRSDYDKALNRATTAEDALATERKAKTDAEIETAINSALKAGKITPATKDYHVEQCRQEGGLERFKNFVEAAPVIGDPAKFDGDRPEETTKELNAEEKRVADMMGVDPEEVKKTKAAD